VGGSGAADGEIAAGRRGRGSRRGRVEGSTTAGEREKATVASSHIIVASTEGVGLHPLKSRLRVRSGTRGGSRGRWHWEPHPRVREGTVAHYRNPRLCLEFDSVPRAK
jgi:hypothetical protein